MRLIFIPTFSNVLGASRDPPTFHISGVFDPFYQSSECRGAGNRHPDQPRKDRSPEPVHFYELHWSRPFVIGPQNGADLFWSNIYTSPQSGGPLLNGCCDQIGDRFGRRLIHVTQFYVAQGFAGPFKQAIRIG